MASRIPIDYARLNDALLQRAPELLARWLPNGVERNGRYYIGNFDGSPGESANVNLTTGQWIDNGAPDDVGRDLVSLYARIRNISNSAAALELMEILGWTHGVQTSESSARSPASQVAGPRDDVPPWEAGDGGSPVQHPPVDATRLGGVGPVGGAVGKRRSMWRALVPVPAKAPLPKFRWGYLDKPSGTWFELEATRTWRYEFEGVYYGHVARFERVRSSGELVKDTLPLTWCVDESDGRGTQRWHWKMWETPRPLYVPATLLSADLSLPVVVVEGEKCAEEGHKLLGHEFDFVSWPGGAKAWPMASWGWLMGRTVYLWPDCDAKRKALTKAEREAGVDASTKPLLPAPMQPGTQAMNGIGSELQAQQGCTVFMCRIPKPGDVADGWDIADAIAQGWDAAQVRDFIRSALPFQAPDDAVRARVGHPEKSARSSADAESVEGGADSAGAAPWRKHLLLSATGSIKPVRENVVLALDGWQEKGVAGVPEAAGLIAFNEFTNNVDKLRDTPWGTGAGAWEECDELLMGQWLVREHCLPSIPREQLEQAVLMVARLHAYHPVRLQVEARRGKWDSVKRLDTWLRRTCLEEDEFDDSDPLQQYLSLAGRWFIMAMCARVLPTVKQGARIVRGPGTKFDYMLIFEGPQGFGKSSLAAVLGGEYFADTGLMIGEKDSYQNIQGVRVYEWGELENMSRQEVSKVKLFVSSWKDRFRASFDRRPRDYPRQVVFVGTTNESHYLTDTTGNRRFWPVRVTQPPDSAWLAEQLDQLISEALVLLDAGERFWPTREEQCRLFDPQQQARTVESSIESSIRHFLFDEDQKVPHGGSNGAMLNEIGMGELLNRIGYTIDKQSDAVVKKAGAVMHMLGWSVRRTSQPGRPRVYVRPKSSPSSTPGGRDGGANANSPPQGNDDEGRDGCPF